MAASGRGDGYGGEEGRGHGRCWLKMKGGAGSASTMAPVGG